MKTVLHPSQLIASQFPSSARLIATGKLFATPATESPSKLLAATESPSKLTTRSQSYPSTLAKKTLPSARLNPLHTYPCMARSRLSPAPPATGEGAPPWAYASECVAGKYSTVAWYTLPTESRGRNRCRPCTLVTQYLLWS